MVQAWAIECRLGYYSLRGQACTAEVPALAGIPGKFRLKPGLQPAYFFPREV